MSIMTRFIFLVIPKITSVPFKSNKKLLVSILPNVMKQEPLEIMSRIDSEIFKCPDEAISVQCKRSNINVNVTDGC